MPHIVVEYSNNSAINHQIDSLLTGVFQGAVKAGLFTDDDIKIRAMAFEHFRVGCSDKGFIHVNAKILSGRTLAQRQLLTDCILAQLAMIDLANVSLTVEITDIDRESYGKLVR